MQVCLRSWPMSNRNRPFALNGCKINHAACSQHAEKTGDVLCGKGVELGHHSGVEAVLTDKRTPDLKRTIADPVARRRVRLLEESGFRQGLDETLSIAGRETE